MLTKSRLNYISGLAILLFSVLVCRLIFLQIFQYEAYSIKSAKIRARTIPNIAPRGYIYDRNQKVLASNRPVFSAYIIPVKIEDAPRASKVIANVLHEDHKEIYKKLLRQKWKSFEPLLIKDYISFETISLIEEQGHKLPGFVVGARNIRDYNYGAMSAHTLGYLGEITPQRLAEKREQGYRSGDVVGKQGVEFQYEAYLRGINGGQQVEVDSGGRPIKILSTIAPIPGNNTVLTIDLELQKVAEEALGKNKGAVIAIDPHSGEILALVSHPGFEPNLFTSPISSKQWAALHSADSPLHNRALTAYPPGSTFKIITAITALENDLFSPADRFYCPGYLMIGRRKADCWKTHGHINFFEGMVHSCDVVFYNLGLKSGPDNIHKTGASFGLGEKTDIDLPGESKGVLPSSKWKERVFKEPWYPGDSFNYGIGQGFLQVTPLQLAQMMSILATKGVAYQPHLLKEITSPTQKPLLTSTPKATRRVTLKPSTWAYLKDTLSEVVYRGTGVALLELKIPVAGKTGTAEDPPRTQPHAWFVSYAPVEKPELVVVVFVEGGGHGGAVAAPIARQVYAKFFEGRIEASPTSSTIQRTE